MDFNEIVMHTGNEPYIEQYGYSEQVIRNCSQLYVAAMALPGLHNHEEVRVDSSKRTRLSLKVHSYKPITIDRWWG
eukprot:243549-Amphidinium_carterae.4